jgi:hypothetical protein
MRMRAERAIIAPQRTWRFARLAQILRRVKSALLRMTRFEKEREKNGKVEMD